MSTAAGLFFRHRHLLPPPPPFTFSLFHCVYDVCVGTCGCYSAMALVGRPEGTAAGLSSPSTFTGVLGLQLWPSDLYSKFLCLLSHLARPLTLFSASLPVPHPVRHSAFLAVSDGIRSSLSVPAQPPRALETQVRIQVPGPHVTNL